MTAAIRVAHAGPHTLGEGVLWDDRTQCVFWTDIAGSRLWRLHPADGSVTHWDMPERLASFALCETDGWLLLALASQLAFFHLQDQRLQPLHAIEPGLPTRANDGACDRQGRFVFGTLHEPVHGPKRPIGGLYRLHHDLSLEPLPLPGMAISNSIAFSPAGDRMYFCDSPTRQILCCDYGNLLGAPRVFVDLGDIEGEPDGSTVDAQGALWNAQWGMHRVVRYLPDGRENRIVAMPARQPTRPALGGTNLQTLYVTSACDGLTESQLADDPLAGALFAFDVEVTGLREPRFAGVPTHDG
ncbi:SMP-30/gluconolactonase/LRE family protein [Dyella tabacisoli]|uniref:SMP-30/gluconolactonase/LRE family protein n=1 Tax=Dyella tabacisoli TaxID=2282381 RepID=A0A369UNE7_9GAMM|nr:SMP-30/gluconolactonase/LRE family protein [Dyella tabacisoli]RDD82166.1 SMP-30/gluconolactonase/LRE family protein [Dyella tabacisoli]